MLNLRKEKDLKKFLGKLPEKFSIDHIDVREYLGEGIYLLKNGDLGTVLRFPGLHDEALTNNELEGKLSTLHKSFRSIIQGIPSFEKKSNTVLQVHFRQRSICKEDIDNGLHDKVKDDLIRKIILEEEDYHLKTKNIKKREILISIRFIVNKNKKTPLLEDLKKFLNKNISTNEYRCEIEKNIKLFKEEINNVSHSISRDFLLMPLYPSDLIEFIQGYFNFGNKVPVISSSNDINKQIIIPEIKDIDEFEKKSENKGVIQTSNGNIKSFYIDQLPSSYMYGQFRLFLDEFPITNFDLTWTLSHGRTDFGSDLIAKEGWYSRKPSKEAITREFSKFREEISSTRPHVIQSIKVLVYNVDKDKEGYLQSICMDYMGGRLIKEVQIPIHMLATSLPLNCLPLQNKIKGGRYKKIRLENALSYAPIYRGASCSNGTRNWITRQGSLTSFDLFSGSGNKMTSFVGPGRNLVTNQILEFLGRFPDGIVRVIDKNSSGDQLVDLVNGRTISFSESALKVNPYSPFALDNWDEDDIENLYLLISTVLIQKNKGIEMSACHSEVLRESIKLAYNSHLKNITDAQKQNVDIDPHPIWSDILSQMPQVCENLKASGVSGADKARDDLAKWSINLYQTGQYGFIFSKYEKINSKEKKERFIKYNLDGIQDDILRQLAAMMAFIKITRDLAKLSHEIPKLIIFEEIGMLLQGDSEAQKLMNQFIEMVIKTCSKFNAQSFIIDPNASTYFNTSAGKTIWENSPQKVIMPLGDLFTNFKKATSEEYNEADLQIIESLKNDFHSKTSEAYIYSENETSPYRGSITDTVSPFMNALCSNSGFDRNLYKQIRESGKSCINSLIQMAEKYPQRESAK